MKRTLLTSVFLSFVFACLAGPSMQRELCFEENAGRYTAPDLEIRYVLKAELLTYYFFGNGYAVVQKNENGISNRTDFIFGPDLSLEASDEVPVKLLSYSATGKNEIHGFRKIVYHDQLNGYDLEFFVQSGSMAKKMIFTSAGFNRTVTHKMYGAREETLPGQDGYRFTSPAGSFTEVLQAREGNSVCTIARPYTYPGYSGKADLHYYVMRTYDPLSTASSSLLWLTYLGGSNSEDVFGITLAADSGVVVTGRTSSTNFPVTTGAFQDSSAQNYDALITRFDKNGNCLWSTYFGGSNFDGANDIITLDSTFVIAGMTNSPNLPILNASQPSNAGGYNAFLAMFDASGQLVRSTYFGGTGSEQGLKLAKGNAGEILLAGSATSTNLPYANLGYQTNMAGMIDAFVALFDNTLTPQWSSYYGGTGVEDVHTITVTPLNEIAFAGATRSFDFPVTANAYQPGLLSAPDNYIVKFSMTGARLYATFFGGTNDEDANGIVGDAAGNIYLTGYTYSVDFPTAGTVFQPSLLGQSDVYVARFDSTGQLVWSTFIGGGSQDIGWGIQRLGQYLFICGQTESATFPVSANAIQSTYVANSDGFVIKMDTSGQMVSGTFMGGNGVDALLGLTVDADTNVFACGDTYSINLATANAYQLTNSGSGDGYVVKFGMSEQLVSTHLVFANETTTLSAYPNPADDFISLELTGGNIISGLQIFDASGRMVAHSTVQSARATLSTATLEAGVYFARVTDESLATHTLRFVVK
jgi:hypothetical protein